MASVAFRIVLWSALVVLAATISLYALAGQRWWIDFLTLFQPVTLFAAIIMVGLGWLTRSRWLIGACAVIVLISAVIVLAPGLSAASPADKDGRFLRVATFNLLYDNPRLDLVAQWARMNTFDLLAVQEVSGSAVANFKGLSDIYPYSAQLTAQRGWASVNLLSRHPIKSAHFQTMPGQWRVVVTAIVEIQGRDVAVSVLHAPTMRSDSLWRERNAYLISAAASINDEVSQHLTATGNIPSIVFGDINTARWSPYFRQFLASAAMKDADRSVLPRASRALVYKAGWSIGAPIDHVLVSQDIGTGGCRRGPYLGSDHLPLICRLQLP